jgi:hypothetical protein
MAVQCLILADARNAAAQAETKLSDKIPDLLAENALANLEIFQQAGVNLDPSFVIQQIGLAVPLATTISSQLSSFPLGSSAGGFSWTFDPALGTFNRVSDSFGPVFAERALTVGRGRMNIGVNLQRATFDKFEDVDLDGGIKIYTGLPAVFIEDSLHLKLSTDIIGIFGTYGVTDRLDVGVAVPIVHTELDASITSLIGGNGTVDTSHTYQGGSTSGTATGVGDVVLRGKYNLWRAAGGGLAAGVDVRLPTGDELDLLGIPGTQAKVYAAISGAAGRLSPHFNIGYTISHESDAANDPGAFVFAPPDEFNYAGGVDVAVTPRFTLVGDVVGRTLRDFGKPVEKPAGVGGSFTQFGFEAGNFNQLLGSVGVKFNPFGQSLVAVNVLFPLDEQGLRDNLTWLVGFEHSFKFGK